MKEACGAVITGAESVDEALHTMLLQVLGVNRSLSG